MVSRIERWYSETRESMILEESFWISISNLDIRSRETLSAPWSMTASICQSDSWLAQGWKSKYGTDRPSIHIWRIHQILYAYRNFLPGQDSRRDVSKGRSILRNVSRFFVWTKTALAVTFYLIMKKENEIIPEQFLLPLQNVCLPRSSHSLAGQTQEFERWWDQHLFQASPHLAQHRYIPKSTLPVVNANY